MNPPTEQDEDCHQMSQFTHRIYFLKKSLQKHMMVIGMVEMITMGQSHINILRVAGVRRHSGIDNF